MPEANHYPALQPQSFVFQSLFDRDGDESKAKPYGGILSEAEADTTKTFPVSADRKRFEDARQKAEQDWRRKVEEQREAEAAKVHQKSAGPPTKVKCINFAGYEIDTWHAAPYPEEYSRNRVLYICEFCLKYMNSDFVAWRHKVRCWFVGPMRSYADRSRSSNALPSILLGTRSIAMVLSLSSRSMAGRTRSTARISASSPSCSLARRHSTTMLSRSCFTS